MSKVFTLRNVVILLIVVIIIFISIPVIRAYTYFAGLEVYEERGATIIKDGIIYHDSPALFRKYLSGELMTERTIGRFKQDKFWGFKTWVIKFKGIEVEEMFLIRGLMYEGVYVKSSK